MDKELDGWSYGSMSKWRLMMSGVPGGSVLGLMFFKIFINSLESRIECSIRKFADDTKLCGIVETTEGRDPSKGILTRWKNEIM